MAKITRSSLAQLAQEMHVLPEQEQKKHIGGSNPAYSPFGNSENRAEDFASVQNPLSTQIGETENPHAGTMLFDAEGNHPQHEFFATAFIEESGFAGGTSGGIGVADGDGFGSGGIGSGGIDTWINDNDAPKKNKHRSFDDCQDIVFENEGGWSNHPNDRGGRTNFGITEKTFNSYKRNHPEAGLTDLDKLTKEQAKKIYKKNYWDSMKADELNSGNVALLVYDMQVNHGGGNAALITQRAIKSIGGDVTIDKVWGPQTRKQLNAFSEKEEQRLCEAILKERSRFYQEIVQKNPSQKAFLKGWNNRMTHLKEHLNY